MEIILGIASVVVGLFYAFFKGRKSGKTEAKLERVQRDEEIKITIQKADNAVNSEDRDSLIAGLVADSVRGTRQDR